MLVQLAEEFANEEAAIKCFEALLRPDGSRACARCGSTNAHEASHAMMPYRCRDCKKYFSVRIGTVVAGSPKPLRKWAFAMYLDSTSLKGIASTKLHRDIDVTQTTAWFMLQRIREAFDAKGRTVLERPVEVNETYIGGKRRNMNSSKHREMDGHGAVGKMTELANGDRLTCTVAGEVVSDTEEETPKEFFLSHTK